MNTSDERALGIPVLVIKPASGDHVYNYFLYLLNCKLFVCLFVCLG